MGRLDGIGSGGALVKSVAGWFGVLRMLGSICSGGIFKTDGTVGPIGILPITRTICRGIGVVSAI